MRPIITLISFVFSLSLLVACDDGGTKAADPVCGNGVVETGEACDGADFAGMTCESFGQPAGALNCTTQCTMDLSGCRELNVCGDGIRDAGEACEDDDFGDMTCASFGLEAGDLVCTETCTINPAGCHDLDVCGNGIMETGEACDGEDFGTFTCASFGFDEGTLTCSEACTIDTATCGSVPPECGDGITQPENAEDCDGSDLNGETCQSIGYAEGALACLPDCRFDTSDCSGFFTLTGRVWSPGADNPSVQEVNWFPIAGARVAAYLSEPPAPTPLPTGLCSPCEEIPASTPAGITEPDGTFELQVQPNTTYWLLVQKGHFRRVSQVTTGNAGAIESLEPSPGLPRNPITTLPSQTIPASRQWIPKILIVEGNYERLNYIFEALGFLYGTEIVIVDDAASYNLFNDINQLRQYQVIIATSGDDASYLTLPAIRANLQQYIFDGGILIAHDFAYDFNEQPFPEFLSYLASGNICGDGVNASSSIGECNNWSSYTPTGTAGDSTFGLWINHVNGGGAFQLLGVWNIINGLSAGLQGNCSDLNDPYCIDGNLIAPPKVWLYGDWSTFTNTPLAVSWNYYCGRMLYSAVKSHSGSGSTGYSYQLLLQEKILLYLLLEMQECAEPSLL